MSNIKISVCLTSFNRARYLPHCLWLYANKQTLPLDMFEVLVLDDGSTDNTYEVCQQFKDMMNIRYFYTDRKKNWVGGKYGLSSVMLNYAARHAIRSNYLLYTDPEALPMNRCLEEFYLSTIPGYIVHECSKWSSVYPGRDEGRVSSIYHKTPEETREKYGSGIINAAYDCGYPLVVEDNVSYGVIAVATKSWAEHIGTFGEWETWAKDGKLKDIERFWDEYWEKIHTLPYNFVDHPDYGFGYRDGQQSFWGLYALQIEKETYLKMGGFEEKLEVQNRWVGEDHEFRVRFERQGNTRWLINPNARFFALYHAKAPVIIDETRHKMFSEFLNSEQNLVANVGRNWGDPVENKIYEVPL